MRLEQFEALEEATAALAAISGQVEPSPCPFLRDGGCSVYDVRPMACRLLLNLDDDDLLCQLVHGQAIPVPYANGQQLKAVFQMAQPAAAAVAPSLVGFLMRGWPYAPALSIRSL